jgi:hypothetical protein
LNREKKPIKPIKILKKPTGVVRFWFYKPETEKTKLKKTKRNRKKPSRTGLNWFLSKKTEPKPKPVGLNLSRFDFGFFLKKLSLVTFFYKTEPNQI